MPRRPWSTVALSFLCLVAAPAHAREPGLQDVLSAATLDLNDDGELDRAVLVQNEDRDAADLLLYLSHVRRGRSTLELELTAKVVAYSGELLGQLASLAVSPRGSLLLVHGYQLPPAVNAGQLDDRRWSETVTVVYREKRFLVVGFTHTGVDPRQAGKPVSCDLNLLTGNGQRDGKPIKVQRKPVPLIDWDWRAAMPGECRDPA